MATAEATLDGSTRRADAAHPITTKLVIMAWSGDLDKIWPTFILGYHRCRDGDGHHDLLHFLGTVPARPATTSTSRARTGCRR